MQMVVQQQKLHKQQRIQQHIHFLVENQVLLVLRDLVEQLILMKIMLQH
jgi:hypothetical protein